MMQNVVCDAKLQDIKVLTLLVLKYLTKALLE